MAKKAEEAKEEEVDEVEEPKERNPHSPLEFLILNRDAESIKLRLASGNVNTGRVSKGPAGDGPLHCAAIACQTKTPASAKVAYKILDDLLEAGFDVDARNDLGRTPLHLAVLHCSAEAVKRILNGRGDSNVTDNFGQTAVDYARTLDEWSRDNGGMALVKKLLGIKAPKPKPKKERVQEEPEVHFSHCTPYVDPSPTKSSAIGSGQVSTVRPSVLRAAAKQLMNTTERDTQWISSAQASGRGVYRVVPDKLSTLKKGPPQPTLGEEPQVNWSTEWPCEELPPEPKYSVLAGSRRGRPSVNVELTSLPLRPWHTRSHGSCLSARAA